MTVIEEAYAWSKPLEKRSRTKYLVLHHEAGSGSTAQEIHRYHLGKGWSGIAYHYYVRKDGSVYRGRPENTSGAHTLNYNSVSIGVCFEGNFESEPMYARQAEAGKALVKDILTRYPDVQIVGHKELNATACPGTYFPLEEFKHITVTEEEAEMKRYNTIEELPEWAVKTIVLLCAKGVLRGQGAPADADGYPTDLNLSEDMLRLLVMNDRAGVYGE